MTSKSQVNSQQRMSLRKEGIKLPEQINFVQDADDVDELAVTNSKHEVKLDVQEPVALIQSYANTRT